MPLSGRLRVGPDCLRPARDGPSARMGPADQGGRLGQETSPPALRGRGDPDDVHHRCGSQRAVRNTADTRRGGGMIVFWFIYFGVCTLVLLACGIAMIKIGLEE